MNGLFKIVTCLATLHLLSACTVGEDYKKPDLNMPFEWSSQHEKCKAKECSPYDNWWKRANDKTLDKLINLAIANNNNLKIVSARIDEASAMRNEKKSDLFPDIVINSSAIREGGQSSNGGVDKPHDKWGAGINGEWDIDVFGGKRSLLAAGNTNLLSAQAKYRQALLILIADIGRSYTDMRAMEELYRLTLSNYKLQEETMRITELQYKSNAVSKLDFLRAKAQAQSTRAKIPAVKVSLAAAKHRLAVLVGANVGDIDDILKQKGSIPKFKNSIIVNTPLSVIAARPDVRIAEYTLMETVSLKNSISAELFPKLTLSGFLGIGGSSIFGASNPWSIGASAIMPLLKFGRIENKIKAADARKMQAFYNYKQVVISAIEEVENALSAYNGEIERKRYFSAAAESYAEAARLARIKYKSGDTNFLDVLIAEENLLNAQTDAVMSAANVSKNTILLYTALGVTDLSVN